LCNQFEAQRAQQQEIDAARKAAADRKLKKTQGREWDWEKTEDVSVLSVDLFWDRTN
jgi:hypothetical protein